MVKKIMSLVTALTDTEGRPARNLMVTQAPVDGFLVTVSVPNGTTRKWFTVTEDLADELLIRLGGTLSHQTHTGAIFYKFLDGGTGVVLPVKVGHCLLNVAR